MPLRCCEGSPGIQRQEILNTEALRIMHIQEEAKDLLNELINTGVGRAAKTLNELIQYEIQLHLPRINLFTLNEMKAVLEETASGEYVNVIQDFEGLLEGVGILSFPIVNGKTLVNLLLDQEDFEEESHDETALSLTEMEAICEVGNNIINSVQGTISDMVSLECQYHLPETVISPTIIPQNRMKQDEVYLFGEVMFKGSGIDVEGVILLIYTYKNIQLLMEKYIDLLVPYNSVPA